LLWARWAHETVLNPCAAVATRVLPVESGQPHRDRRSIAQHSPLAKTYFFDPKTDGGKGSQRAMAGQAPTGLVETRALLADTERLLAESADHLRTALAAYDRTELLIARAQGQIRACEALLARTHRQLQTWKGSDE